MASFSDSALAALSFKHLQSVVALDSQSDERSSSIPSSPGQAVVADFVAAHMRAAGATVERDAFANMIATFPGRGRGASAPPLALLVHLDTARGTSNPPTLNVKDAWDGSPIPYPDNPTLEVSVANYPALQPFVGHDIVFGGGKSPFGLDDKLGLTHLMTLAHLIAEDPSFDHPPLLLIGRPDEEIGRMEAVVGLAELLASRGVHTGYTVDGIVPFEVNVQNFNAARAQAKFTGSDISNKLSTSNHGLLLHLGGVNTHGATAFEEGHRTAVRFAAELLAAAGDRALPLRFDSDALRDCDATLLLATTAADLSDVRALAEAIVAPHLPRGASLRIEALSPAQLTAIRPAHPTDALSHLFGAITRFAATATPELPLWCEDSHGFQGYSHAYRARTTAEGAILDLRIRDFDPTALEARKAAIHNIFAAAGAQVESHNQYVDMSPRLADRRDLVDLAVAAGEDVDREVRELPIRGGTGVDPFLDRGVAIANLGTGYFAPESEKEITSLAFMAGHARWLVALLQRFAGLR